MLILTTFLLLTPSQKALTNCSGFWMPSMAKVWFLFSFTPRRINPPSVLANDEYVSQMLFGIPPLASFASKRLPSLKESICSWSNGLIVN